MSRRTPSAFVRLFLLTLLLRLATLLRTIPAAALHITLATHSLLSPHFLLLMLAAHLLMLAAAHAHLLLVTLRIHLLLAFQLLIHGILAATSVSVFGSFVAIPGLISFGVPTFFTVPFTAHSCSLALMIGDMPNPVFSSTLFAMFFTARSCSLALMFTEISSPVLSSTFFAMFFIAHSFSLSAMFGHVPGLLFALSRSRPASFFAALPFAFSPCHALSFCAWPFTFSTCDALSLGAGASTRGFIE